MEKAKGEAVDDIISKESIVESNRYASINAQNPWPGLDFFTEDAAAFFNGRERESLLLLNRILDAPLTVLFGKSGLGKTSLLQAGLFPKLRKHKIQPIYVRLNFAKNAPPPVAQIAQRFKAELSRSNIEAPPFQPNETLWEYLHRRELELWRYDNWQITPILIIDQFEEVFTLTRYQDRDAVKDLINFLADLIENRVPADLDRQLESDAFNYKRFDFRSHRLKILLSFREDFLAQFETWKSAIPSLMQNRVRLEPMTYQQAIDAIYKTASESKLVSREVAEKIVHLVEQSTTEIDMSNDRSSGDALVRYATIEPTMLSLICHGLNEARKQKNRAEIDDVLLREERSQPKAIVEEFYNNVLKDLPDSENIKKFIEDELVTSHGYRKRCSKDDAINHGIREEHLRQLENKRLLHHIASDQVSWYELAHDLLTSVVVRSRDTRLAEQERKQNEQKIIEREQKKLLELRAKSADRFRILSVLLFLVVIVAIYQTINAVDATRTAENQRDEISKQKDIAEKQKDFAEKQKAYAEQQKVLAEQASDIAKEKEQEAIKAKKAAEDANKAVVKKNHQLQITLDKVNKLNTKIQKQIEEIKKERQKNKELDTLAKDNQTKADSASKLAAKKNALAQSKELALRADSVFATQPEVAYRVAEMSIDKNPSFLAKRIVWDFYSLPRYRLSDSLPLRNVDGMVMSPQATLFATLDRSSQINLWNASNGKLVQRLIGHKQRVTSVEFSKDGSKLLSASVDGSAKLWDVDSAKELKTIAGNGQRLVSAAMSPDEQQILTLSVGNPKNRINLWDANTARPIFSWEADIEPIAADFSGDGAKIYVAYINNKIDVFDALTHRFIKYYQIHDYSINTMVFSRDGNYFVTTSRNDNLPRLWSLHDLKVAALLRGHTDFVTAAAISPDSKYVVTSSRDNSLRVWEIPSGRELIKTSGSTKWFGAAAIGPNADIMLSVASNDAVQIRQKLNDMAQRVFIGPREKEKYVNSASFSFDDRQIVSASDDGALRIWRSDSQSSPRLIRDSGKQFTSAVFSPDNKIIASADKDGGVKLWDSDSGKSIAELKGHREAVNSLEFSSDGQRLLSASSDGRALLWNVDSKKIFNQLPSGLDRVFVAKYASDGQHIFTIAQDQAAKTTQIMQWDKNGENATDVTPELAAKIVNPGAFSLAGNQAIVGLSNNTAQIWNIDSKKVVATLVGHSNWIVATAFSRDAKVVATASQDNTVMLWDVQSGQRLATLTGHSDAVTSVSFSKDSRYVLSSSIDQSVRLWPGNYQTLFSLINQQNARGDVPPLNAEQTKLYLGDIESPAPD